MSRIGNTPVSIPAGVSVTIADGNVMVKGPKGELTTDIKPHVQVSVEDNKVLVSRNSDEPQIRAFHGLVRALIQNYVIGVTAGFKKTLKLIGTGYRATAKGQGLTLSLGYSHPVEVAAIPGIVLTVEGNDTIHVEGIDKHNVGQVAANIRKLRPPEPYKGKGIRYSDEVVARKAGKTATK